MRRGKSQRPRFRAVQTHGEELRGPPFGLRREDDGLTVRRESSGSDPGAAKGQLAEVRLGHARALQLAAEENRSHETSREKERGDGRAPSRPPPGLRNCNTCRRKVRDMV